MKKLLSIIAAGVLTVTGLAQVRLKDKDEIADPTGYWIYVDGDGGVHKLDPAYFYTASEGASVENDLTAKLGISPSDLGSGTVISVTPGTFNYNTFSTGSSKTYTFSAAPVSGDVYKPYYLQLRNDTAGSYTINLTAPGGVTLHSVERNATLSSFSLVAGQVMTLTFLPTGTTRVEISGVPASLTWIEEIQLTHPHQVDGTGATLNTTASAATYGHATFSNSADQAANYVIYRIGVPADFDSSVDLQASFVFRLGGTDTGKHRYVISMADVTDSAGADSPTFSNAINLDFTGDASGASGDRESVTWTTLTSWRSSLTAGHTLVIKLARDGDDGTNDTSTVSSTDQNLKLKIGHTQ